MFSLECFTEALCYALWHQGEVMVFEMILIWTSEDVARHTGLLQWAAAVFLPHALLPCCLLLPACPCPCPVQLKSLLGRKLQSLINFYQFSKPLFSLLLFAYLFCFLVTLMLLHDCHGKKLGRTFICASFIISVHLCHNDSKSWKRADYRCESALAPHCEEQMLLVGQRLLLHKW